MVNVEERPATDADRTQSLRPCGPCTVRAHGVCNAVVGADLPRLAALATIVQIPRGQTFIHEDAAAEHCCILIHGSAKLYKLMPDGRRQIIGFGYAGSFLGLTESQSYAFSAEAIEPIRMCRMSRRKLQGILDDLPAMERRLFDVIVDDLARAQEHLLLLGRKTSAERLASFLLLEMARARSREMPCPRVHLPMSWCDIADFLGMEHETISRALAKLKHQGMIAMPTLHEVAILDPARLEALARGTLSPPCAEEAKPPVPRPRARPRSGMAPPQALGRPGQNDIQLGRLDI